MAQLIYDETGRLLFTREMKEEYTILMPQMLPVHFGMFRQLLELEGYKVDQLNNTGRAVIDEGLKYVHNDTCYPALLVIGQMIDAVKHGGYDPHKVALFITQTGGGCRASNYIHLLRKALGKAGLSFVPVISVNASGLEKNPGFELSPTLLFKLMCAIAYGDLIMDAANQIRPYEMTQGQTDQLVERWSRRLAEEFQQGKGLAGHRMSANFQQICRDFAAVPTRGEPKVRVGIVGEIYVKFSALGNNRLERFLLEEGAEPVVPGLMDFILYSVHARITDVRLYGGSRLGAALCSAFIAYAEGLQKKMGAAMKRAGLRPCGTFSNLRRGVGGYLSEGNKMGEGWLLTAEMLELIRSGTPNIVCTQPFGCLPNHIAGKGMLRKLKDDFPTSNIVAIDYDPGATKINQENRIKLMLANARELDKKRESNLLQTGEPALAK
ncbi:MAG: 2-hydroxyglutaryl-CoA dehydratase [Ruminococcaceae bacterium]|nr:2-hydroxyglutaryl-CoA dehydratase [Oscillospiraceae bacterium]